MRAFPMTLCLALVLAACGSGTVSSDERSKGSGGERAVGSGGDGGGGEARGDGDGASVAPGDGDADAPIGSGMDAGGGGGEIDAGSGSGSGAGDDGYVSEGVISPSAGDTLEATRAFYDTWTDRYLEPACKDGQFRVKSAPDTAAYTVSEAHGYGMLFTVMMADHDPEAHARFDGLYHYFDEHPSGLTKGLMAWAQDASCKNVMGDDAATDGDLDIAYSLLIADTVWGSQGAIDYAKEAQRVIAAVLKGEVASSNHLLIGDWARDDAHANGTRASDFLPQHFKAYAAASGAARWTSVVDKLYTIVAHVQANEAQSSGLLPDFIVAADTDAPKPAPAKWLESNHDGHYHYNACRVPWRIGTDYLLTGDARARAAMRKLNAFIQGATGGDPAKIVDGYQLDGKPYGGSDELAFVAPFAVSAMIEPESGTNRAWLDALWTHITSHDAKNYYSDSIKLATMIVVSGQWKKP